MVEVLDVGVSRRDESHSKIGYQGCLHSEVEWDKKEAQLIGEYGDLW